MMTLPSNLLRRRGKMCYNSCNAPNGCAFPSSPSNRNRCERKHRFGELRGVTVALPRRAVHVVPVRTYVQTLSTPCDFSLCFCCTSTRLREVGKSLRSQRRSRIVMGSPDSCHASSLFASRHSYPSLPRPPSRIYGSLDDNRKGGARRFLWEKAKAGPPRHVR